MATADSCPRSLLQILIAATSTAAFIAAANFGFAPNISSKAGIWARWFQCLKMEIGEPFRAFAHSLVSAAITWQTIRSEVYEPNELQIKTAAATTGAPSGGRLQKIRQEFRKRVARTGVVAIMLNCPIFIEIPQDFAVKPADNSRSEEGATRKKKANVENISKPEWMKDVKILRDIQDWNALALPVVGSPDVEAAPAAGAAAAADMQEGMSSSHAPLFIKLPDVEAAPAAGAAAAADMQVGSPDVEAAPAADMQEGMSSSHAPLFIKLHPSLWDYSKGIKERRLLLQLKLVPDYQQLRYLRSRSTFEAVVTTLQSFGYMLAVGQRILTHVAVSPLEAIMAFFNLLIVLQFILNLYSSVHYQRPLLLRLSPAQFSMYSQAHSTSPSTSSTSTHHTSKVTTAVFLGIGSVLSVALYAVIQFSFIRYALSYLHRCILCSVSAFLVCFLALSALILIGLFGFPRYRTFWKNLDKQVKVQIVIRICTSIISTSSTILALVATIISWHEFKQPSRNLLEWIYKL